MTNSSAIAGVRRDIDRVDPETVRRALAFPAAILADVAGRRGTMDGRIAAVSPSMRVTTQSPPAARP